MRAPDGDGRDHGASGEETMRGVQEGPSDPAALPAATRPPDAAAHIPVGAAPAVTSTPMRFSVVLCTHNRAAYLRKAVESLFTLDYPADRFEIVVVDNRSTDATPDTVAALRKDAPVPMGYYREPKLGLSHARNTGIRHSRFDHIAYLDDDAAADGRWLSVFDETFRRYGADVVGGKVVPTPVAGYTPPDWFHSDYVWGFYGLDYARQGCAEKIFRVRFPRYLGGGCSCYRRELLSLPWSRFHAGLGRTGKRLYQGEETLLNYFLEKNDYKIFYNADAFILHFIDPERVTRAFVARKAFWGGYSDALMHRKMFGLRFVFRNGPAKFREALAAYREARGSGANESALFEKRCFLLHDTGYLLRLLRFWGLR
jgi:glycosyltransferase involved in cell wall biosynthesis